jgi:hypothetical protein
VDSNVLGLVARRQTRNYKALLRVYNIEALGKRNAAYQCQWPRHVVAGMMEDLDYAYYENNTVRFHFRFVSSHWASAKH